MPVRVLMPFALFGLVVATLQGGVVEDWNAIATRAVRANTLPPPLAARNLAIVHLAMWRAAEADLRPEDRALASAAHEVCLSLFPTQRASFDALLRHGGATNPVPEATSSQARRLARDTLAQRANDGAGLDMPYIPREAPGQWRRTGVDNRPPEGVAWAHVRPFVLERPDVLRPPPPPALDSAGYADGLLEVAVMGSRASTTRTVEQSLVARFWSDFNYTSTPPGHWNEIAREVATRSSLTAREKARVFGVLNVALADAGIAMCDAKYAHNFWRPETAIQRAGEDGNPATQSDSGWESYLPSPPHPEYVSGHASFSGAAAEVLTHLLPLQGAFTARSDSAPGATRKFTNYWDCAREISDSRVYGGIHYRFSGEGGLALGRLVAKDVLEKYGVSGKGMSHEEDQGSSGPVDDGVGRVGG